MTEEIKNNRIKSKEKRKKGEYDVFLSYNPRDDEYVKLIHKWLEDNGITPWRAEWDLKPGSLKQFTLEQEIANSKSAALFIGSAEIGGEQQQEMYAFLQECRERDCNIIPVILPDTPKEIKIPSTLRLYPCIDFRDKDPDPLEHLIWSITGKKPEKVYRPGVLIASLGDSPVIVSSMYDLLTKQEKLTIDRVEVLCPDDEEVQCAYKLIKEALPNTEEFQLCYEPLDFKDADSWRNTCIFLQRLHKLLNHYQEQDESVYLSLAGGRKSMAAIMAWIIPLFPCIKKLYHVIDKKEKYASSALFRSVYDIYTQPSSRRSELMHPKDLSRLSLVEIPIEGRQQISEKLRSQLLSSRPDDFEQAEALITAQVSFQQSDIPELNVTKKLIDKLQDIRDNNEEEARAVYHGLLGMSRISTLNSPEIGIEDYPFKATKSSCVTLRYFTGLNVPIRPVFYTLPANSNDQIERIIICSLEREGTNGYRTLEDVAASPGFSVNPYSSIETLPCVPSPAESILIVPLGKSPMIATQLYTLLREQEKHTIHEVVLIYPQQSTEIRNGAERIDKALRKESGVSCKCVGIPEIEDITNEEACRKYQTCLEAQIERVQLEYPHYKIDLALSGGRKGMTAMTIFAAQKLHIPYVYHTLITNDKLSEKIEEETTVKALNDPHLSLQEAYDRLFLRAYRAEESYPYAHFTLFRVRVFSADGR